ncbi:DUF881 domain-containing protein [Aeromicrobium sp. CF3.5]|uniref:DUF881 domain-containing protein n=1 Tax=Aeromicrobium sp. CF3.5 TaxID=3373078 RepID=UPI003EE5DD43
MPSSATKRGLHAQQRWPLSVLGVFAATGLLFVTAAVSARGNDLRPTGGDVSSLLAERSQRVEDRRGSAGELQARIDELSGAVGGSALDDLRADIEDLEPVTGLTPVSGPGIRVSLTDAPRGAGRPGLDPNVLVVHEQDIQAYVNALWAGGAEAISLQGQRLISTTGIKCVGNTVLLEGVPYSPPYVIEAVGDTTGMMEAIRTTPATSTYADYVREFGLGLEISDPSRIDVPAYSGQVNLEFASRPAGSS